MKKAFFVVLAILVIVLAASNMNRTRTVAVVSGHPEQSPIMFRVGDDITGVGADVVRRIFDDLGVKSTYPYVGVWGDVLDKAKTGEVDVIVAAYKTEERLEYLHYTDAYYPDTVSVFVPADRTFAFETWDDLIGKRGVITDGDSYGQAFDDFRAEHLTVATVADSAAAFELLAAHDADYFVYALLAGDRELALWDGSERITRLPHPVVTEDFFIVISKRSPFARYLEDFNRLIATYKADGTIDNLVAEYQGRD